MGPSEAPSRLAAGGEAGFSAPPASGAPAVEHKWLRPTGIDPNSCYFQEIKLIGNRKMTRKDVQCFSFEQIIDLDLTNYNDLVESIVEKYPPSYLEVAHVQYYDANLETYPEVKSDQELMAMFEKHSMSKGYAGDTPLRHGKATGRAGHERLTIEGSPVGGPVADVDDRCPRAVQKRTAASGRTACAKRSAGRQMQGRRPAPTAAC
ncbi:hypothetical protein C2845_PM07G09850 [Panicum miliaceum]|uniref:Uncharacterized protein n=1 Tax=Panicum miliaceum TaxID=4540 RepID=A0A3L6SUQ0_PANMI|nr:hypothetical protein C2845_PM07G09850 [Panicum miliaceum]